LAEILGWIGILLRPVDPDVVGHGLGDGPSADEPLGMRGPCAVERALADRTQREVPSGVDFRWREVRDAGVMVPVTGSLSSVHPS